MRAAGRVERIWAHEVSRAFSLARTPTYKPSVAASPFWRTRDAAQRGYERILPWDALSIEAHSEERWKDVPDRVFVRVAQAYCALYTAGQYVLDDREGHVPDWWQMLPRGTASA